MSQTGGQLNHGAGRTSGNLGAADAERCKARHDASLALRMDMAAALILVSLFNITSLFVRRFGGMGILITA